MAVRVCITIFVCLAIAGCSDRKNYERVSGSIDSLSLQAGEVLQQLHNTDTARVMKSLVLFYAYRNFLVTGYNDTLATWQGNALARFEAAGLQLEAFVKNRRLLMDRARHISGQLSSLAHDAAEKAINVKALESHLEREKKAAANLSIASEKEITKAGSALQQMDSAIVLIRQIIGASGKN